MKKLKLEIVHIRDFPVVGIATKCISHNEKSDFYDNCDDLWEKIVTEGSLDKIQNKVNDNVVAAYLNYETDHSKPFDFVVGCQVSNIDTIPEGMQAFEMENGVYLKVRSSEKITECHS
ncbi:GyrI-like domain-containing protein [Litoribacter populi]|uniref:GyrI-like domain-containing protein n=1 Tax=Litoribacter populi TaxID=2598460 RepID=UPI00117C71A6|nr:effector binding domain-containing protein [Litoribacter populi]